MTAITGPRTDIRFGDDPYPPGLADLAEPPDVLHVIGEPSILDRPSLAVLGPRRATPYGLQVVSVMVEDIAPLGMPILTGGEVGIAQRAMDMAVALNVPCIAVLGNGLADPYPSENALLFQAIVDHGGCLASEYPDDAPPRPYMFRQRNQLIAAIAHSVLLVEAGISSGTFSMVDTALAPHRDVYAVPGAITSPTSQGSNELLAMGLAKAIDSPERLYAWLSHTIEKGDQLYEVKG